MIHYRWFTKYDMIDEAKRVARDQWGATVGFTTELLPHPIKPALAPGADLKKYSPPDPDENKWRYEIIERMVQRFKGERAIIPCLPDIWNVVKDFFLGDVNYFTGMLDNPEYLHQIGEIPLTFYIRLSRTALTAGADIIWVHGDWAGTRTRSPLPHWQGNSRHPI